MEGPFSSLTSMGAKTNFHTSKRSKFYFHGVKLDYHGRKNRLLYFHGCKSTSTETKILSWKHKNAHGNNYVFASWKRKLAYVEVSTLVWE